MKRRLKNTALFCVVLVHMHPPKHSTHSKQKFKANTRMGGQEFIDAHFVREVHSLQTKLIDTHLEAGNCTRVKPGDG